MHISLGGLLNICENGGGSIHPLKNYGGFCEFPLNFEKLGQRDLNKKNYAQICKKRILNF